MVPYESLERGTGVPRLNGSPALWESVVAKEIAILVCWATKRSREFLRFVADKNNNLSRRCCRYSIAVGVIWSDQYQNAGALDRFQFDGLFFAARVVQERNCGCLDLLMETLNRNLRDGRFVPALYGIHNRETCERVDRVQEKNRCADQHTTNGAKPQSRVQTAWQHEWKKCRKSRTNFQSVHVTKLSMENELASQLRGYLDSWGCLPAFERAICAIILLGFEQSASKEKLKIALRNPALL